MKNTIIIFQAVWVTVAGLATPGFPSRAPLQLKDQAQSVCSIKSKDQYYQDFLASHKGVNRDQAKALEAARRYLTCPSDTHD